MRRREKEKIVKERHTSCEEIRSVEATMGQSGKDGEKLHASCQQVSNSKFQKLPEYLAPMGVRTKYLAIKEEELERLSR